MKVLFSTDKYIYLLDKERMIFRLEDREQNISYCDMNGNPVPPDPALDKKYQDLMNIEAETDPWKSEWIEYEGLEEKLISETTQEVVEEIDDVFGNYGFKNRTGEFVIEPQYAYAHEFTCGLAAVNLNRTWYKSENGRRFYENHYGYINERGQTVIPFAYDEAWPFNKYGVAVVEEVKDRPLYAHLIDTEGRMIPGTEEMNFNPYYDYNDRFLSFTVPSSEKEYDDYDEQPEGIYDTKERKVLMEPVIDDFIEYSEDLIKIYDRKGKYGAGDFHQYYINSKGEIIFPWLHNKGFASVERPNKALLAIVSISKFTAVTNANPSSYFPHNGRKYDRQLLHGVYSSNGKFVLPTEYESIYECAENIFECKKNGVTTVVQIEENDYAGD